jgi:hypothetical protein
MNNADFYAYLGPPPTLPEGTSTSVKLAHVWQFAAVLGACPDDAAVVALTVANPKLAADYANQEAMYEALTAPNMLHATVAAAGSDAAALAQIEAAPPAVRAEYADDLALCEYNQEQLCGQYRQLVLGES